MGFWLCSIRKPRMPPWIRHCNSRFQIAHFKDDKKIWAIYGGESLQGEFHCIPRRLGEDAGACSVFSTGLPGLAGMAHSLISIIYDIGTTSANQYETDFCKLEKMQELAPTFPRVNLVLNSPIYWKIWTISNLTREASATLVQDLCNNWRTSSCKFTMRLKCINHVYWIDLPHLIKATHH